MSLDLRIDRLLRTLRSGRQKRMFADGEMQDSPNLRYVPTVA